VVVASAVLQRSVVGPMSGVAVGGRAHEKRRRGGVAAMVVNQR
jgi:hypothetical protein